MCLAFFRKPSLRAKLKCVIIDVNVTNFFTTGSGCTEDRLDVKKGVNKGGEKKRMMYEGICQLLKYKYIDV